MAGKKEGNVRMRKLFVLIALLALIKTEATAQVYMPQKNGTFLMPDEWLFSTGQPFHYRVGASNQGRPLSSREPTTSERTAIERIRQIFREGESKVVLLGDGDQIVQLEMKPPASESSTLLSASVDKSVTAFSAGIAVCDGKISLDTKAKDLLPELVGTDIGNSTLRDNLMMASGTTTAFDDSQSLTPQETQDMQAGRISFMDLVKGRLGKARLWTKPGERFDYKSQDPLLVGMMVAAAYGAEGKNFRQWQTENFFSKIRLNDRRIQGNDRHGYAQSDGNTRLTIGDWARLAVFIQESRLKRDCYGDYLRQATTTQIKTDRRFARSYGGYGYFVWTNNGDLPNSYSALGYGGQTITWSTTSMKFILVFSNAAPASQLSAMARLWFEAN